MASLNGSKTHQNLKDAFAGESQANRRYLYFANKADVEGLPEVATLFRSTAEGETGHAHGHLDYLAHVGDPATGLPIGSSSDNLKASVAGETHEYTDMYPGMAKPPATKALTKSPIGLKHLPRQSVRTPTSSRKHWTLWPQAPKRNAVDATGCACCIPITLQKKYHPPQKIETDHA